MSLSQSPSGNSTPNPKPFSISLSSKSSSTSKKLSSTPSSQKKSSESLPRRPHVFAAAGKPRTFHDNHSDDEDEQQQQPAAEEVTGWDHTAGGAISAHRKKKDEKQPLVIKVASNNNWRDKPWQRKRKNLIPAEVQAQRAAQQANQAAQGAEPEVEGPSTQFGLSYAAMMGEGEVEAGAEGDHEVTMKDADSDEVVEPKAPLSQDEIALRALMDESKGEDGSGTRRSNLVIESQRQPSPDDEYEIYDETSAFRVDVTSRPEPASLADYASVPVEEFGAALLRGMGWKDGDPIGKGKYSGAGSLKARVPERRPGYLGIGAKDISGKAGSSELELGAWGKATMRKAKKEGEGLYTPVLMRSKKTGEMITEDEFKALAKEGGEKKGEEDWRERRDRNLKRNGRDRRLDSGDEESDSYRKSDKYSRRNGSLSPVDRDRDSRHRRRHDDEDLESESGRDDRYYRDRDQGRSDRRHRGSDRDRDSNRYRERDNDGDRRDRGSRRSKEDDKYDSRASSSTSSKRDRESDRDRRRDRDRSRNRRHRHDDDGRRSSKRED
ncbi:hypothetical protein AJ80_05391 [Polytolypa hystricis UAMH7299]|uniref:Pre-mRNA-splicing factor n=1 Tax=Polytolypa hystricis (strain UAMH7299) TaxID=1447883 RepID=A0A2B7Y3P1_POLH7|nr:hypothetical protein AJ80_05391 [Polytolypa hystricis UAMH7299]